MESNMVKKSHVHKLNSFVGHVIDRIFHLCLEKTCPENITPVACRDRKLVRASFRVV